MIYDTPLSLSPDMPVSVSFSPTLYTIIFIFTFLVFTFYCFLLFLFSPIFAFAHFVFAFLTSLLLCSLSCFRPYKVIPAETRAWELIVWSWLFHRDNNWTVAFEILFAWDHGFYIDDNTLTNLYIKLVSFDF